jgi:hypothetical protein
MNFRGIFPEKSILFSLFCFIGYLKPAKIYPEIPNPLVSSLFRARAGSSASCYAPLGRSLLPVGGGRGLVMVTIIPEKILRGEPCC